MEYDLKYFNESVEVMGGITKNCFDWCKEQHFVNQNNLTIKAMAIPLIALICLFFASLVYKFSDKIIANTDLTEEYLSKMIYYCYNLAMYMLMGFFIWFIFFK